MTVIAGGIYTANYFMKVQKRKQDLERHYTEHSPINPV